jgi:L-seryl-tRNA(Ser) seleniumtransferase
LRADKLTLAALEATLALYRTPDAALVEIPVLRMLILSAAELERRAERLRSSIERLRPPDFPPSRLVPGSSAVGGGAFPNAELPTTLVSLDPGSLGAQTLALRLRLGIPPVIARVQDDRVTLDPRTLAEDQLEAVAAAVLHALEEA